MWFYQNFGSKYFDMVAFQFQDTAHEKYPVMHGSLGSACLLFSISQNALRPSH